MAPGCPLTGLRLNLIPNAQSKNRTNYLPVSSHDSNDKLQQFTAKEKNKNRTPHSPTCDIPA